jgi:ATP/maltotriose-dependent transcriptional regulator MalT
MGLRIGRPDLAVVALDSVQHNLQRQLRYEAAYESSRRRLELAHGAGDLGELGDSYAVAAWNAIYFGLLEEAHAVGREGFELLRSDAPMYAVHDMCWAALASFYLGEWEACLQEFELVVAGARERGEALVSGFSAPWPAAALIHEARGDRDASERLLEQVYGIEERSRKRVSSMLSPLVVRTLLLRGDMRAARARLDAVLEDDPMPENLPLLQLAEAELLLAEERWDELDAFAAVLRRTGESSGARYLGATADRVAGRAAVARGEPAEAMPLLEAAAAGYDAVGMAVHAAVARLDAAEVAAATGRGDDARRLADAAAGPLRRVGFRAEIDRAERLLSRADA